VARRAKPAWQKDLPLSFKKESLAKKTDASGPSGRWMDL
jgi:hypothetical protein